MSGEAHADGADVVLSNLTFASTVRDLPAVANYLIARGFADVRYGVEVQRFSDAGDPSLDFHR